MHKTLLPFFLHPPLFPVTYWIKSEPFINWPLPVCSVFDTTSHITFYIPMLASHPEQTIMFKASVLVTYCFLLWQLPSLSLTLSTLFILQALLWDHLISETILLEI